MHPLEGVNRHLALDLADALAADQDGLAEGATGQDIDHLFDRDDVVRRAFQQGAGKGLAVVAGEHQVIVGLAQVGQAMPAGAVDEVAKADRLVGVLKVFMGHVIVRQVLQAVMAGAQHLAIGAFFRRVVAQEFQQVARHADAGLLVVRRRDHQGEGIAQGLPHPPAGQDIVADIGQPPR